MRDGLRWTLVATAAVVGLAMAATLRFTDWGTIPSSRDVITVHHPQGWTLTLSRRIEGQQVEVQLLPDGFLVDPDGGGLVRYRREAWVAFRRGGDPPATAWYRARWIDGAWVRYAVRWEENGNGDAIVTLTAWRRCGAGRLWFVQVDHSELSTPGFDHAWAMIRGLSTGDLCSRR
jgi:hypothetical protein